MSDDIVTRLRQEVAKAENDGRLLSWELAKCAWTAADEIERLRSVSAMLRDEIERLRKALALAVGELSTYGPYGNRSPEQLYEFFLWTVSDDR